jgi:hypothetical protein
MIYGESKTADDMNLEMVRHMCLYKLNQIEGTFKGQQLVVCFDHGRSWRYALHPGYKSTRKKLQDERKVKAVQYFSQLKEEFQKSLPYSLVCVDTAEADDCMAVLSRLEGTHTVVSGDKDMAQLISDRVKVFNPFGNSGTGSYVVHSDLKRYVYEHVMKGDDSDAIPNVKSDLDIIGSGRRQTPIRQTWMDEFYSDYVKGNYGSLSDRVELNKRLVLFEYIPSSLEFEILAAFGEDKNKVYKRRLNFTNYCIQHDLMRILQL